MKPLLQFLADERAATAVEYAVLLALLVGMMVASVQSFGVAARGLSDDTVNALSDNLND